MTDNTWQPPEHIKPWMVCAAIKHGAIIIAGARHYDNVMRPHVAMLATCEMPLEWEQGFIDQWGRFYTREAAMETVKASGQPFNIERNGHQDKKLFSEGLY